jgi:hypothetical protein
MLYMLYRKAPMTTISKSALRSLKVAKRSGGKSSIQRAKAKGSGTPTSAILGNQYVRIKLGGVTVQAKALGIAAGRAALPKLVQGSIGLGDAFLVRNVKNPLAPNVLVINPAALDEELSRNRPKRTLGEIVSTLPFGRRGVPSLTAGALPDSGVGERLRVPGRVQSVRKYDAEGIGPSAPALER